MEQQERITRALSQKGKPYRWGANGQDAYDCMGLVQYAAKATGKDWNVAQCRAASEPVAPGDERPGDVVIPLGQRHIGLYIGTDYDNPHRIVVIHSGGGDASTTTDARAKEQNACVKLDSWARTACEVRRWTP